MLKGITPKGKGLNSKGLTYQMDVTTTAVSCKTVMHCAGKKLQQPLKQNKLRQHSSTSYSCRSSRTAVSFPGHSPTLCFSGGNSLGTGLVGLHYYREVKLLKQKSHHDYRWKSVITLLIITSLCSYFVFLEYLPSLETSHFLFHFLFTW